MWGLVFAICERRIVNICTRFNFRIPQWIWQKARAEMTPCKQQNNPHMRSARKPVAPEQNQGALKGRCTKAPEIETVAPEQNT